MVFLVSIQKIMYNVSACMGLPTWKPSGISLNGKDAIGAPSWSACSRKIPDLSCIVRCLGEKVIGNVRANRKQVELQVR